MFSKHGIGHSEPLDRSSKRQLLAFAGGPAAVGLSMQVKTLTVNWACEHGSTLVLHASALAGIALAIASGLLAAREWRAAGGGWPDDAGGALGRSRFLTVIAMLLCAVSALVIVAQWIPDVVLHPCQH
jgi:hypothetical protein